MGLMRFQVFPPDRITGDAADRAFLTGPEQIPWVSRVQSSDGTLTVARKTSDSAALCIPWLVDGHGEVTLSTGTLIERGEPYHLQVELARGVIHHLRSQLSEWQAAGLQVPDSIHAALRGALEEFAAAATRQHQPQEAAAHAERAIRAALDVAELLSARYVEQALLVRHRLSQRLPTLLGVNLGHRLLDASMGRQVLQAFNAAVVPVVWRNVEGTEGNYQWGIYDRQVDWCQAHELKVVAGPLLRLDNRGLPDWLAIWEGDFDNLLSFVSDYVETAVNRFRGKVHLWQCAARVNVGDVLSLSEEEKLRLAVRAFEITRKVDPDTPAIVRFDQPWAEYMARQDCDLSPLHFADVLVRSGLELSGVGLDINVGYWPGGTYPRDRLDYSRQLDRWSCLGLPLWLTLNVPSSRAHRRTSLWPRRAVGHGARGRLDARPATSVGQKLLTVDLVQAGGARRVLQSSLRRAAARISAQRVVRRHGRGQAGVGLAGRFAKEAFDVADCNPWVAAPRVPLSPEHFLWERGWR